MRKLRWIGAAVLGVAALGIGAVLLVPELRFRAELVLNKARGQYPEASWPEFLRMLKPGSGFPLEDLDRHGSLYRVVDNPYDSEPHLKQGKERFANTCAACHGAEGGGGVGPSLIGRSTPRTETDWAMYRTVRHGVPGTAMMGVDVGWTETWQLVGFVRSLVLKDSPGAAHRDALLEATRPVTPERIAGAANTPQEWLTYGGDYSANRYSSLTGVTRENIGSLKLMWIYQAMTDYRRMENTPLVADGVMYVSYPPSDVVALDAATGRELWKHSARLPGDMIGAGAWKVSRGTALLGDRVFLATLDARVKALDAKTGKKLWDVSLGDYRTGYAFTGAPLAVKDLVIVGSSGGDFATRGFIAALDAKTGKERWRFNTIPQPGEPHGDTWAGDSAREGGAAPWMTGSYDSVTNTIYWGIGNPAPDHEGSMREGDNLFSCSVVALDADTGKLRWHFQFTPHDLHDWDSTQVPVLIDDASGAPRLLFANRNGFFYALDRSNGKFISATAFVKQTWASSIDENGRPVVIPGSEPTLQGSLVYPSAEGATNWWPPAYSRRDRLIFVPFMERGAIFYSHPVRDSEEGELYLLGATSGLAEPFRSGVLAIDPATGKTVWRTEHVARLDKPETGGLLATAGGVVFGGDAEHFFALDSASGSRLWEMSVGAPGTSAPMSYAVGGPQFIAVNAGRTVLSFGVAAPISAPTRPLTAK
jgi:alcohol dehydrogenase (cytochrome c)